VSATELRQAYAIATPQPFDAAFFEVVPVELQRRQVAYQVA